MRTEKRVMSRHVLVHTWSFHAGLRRRHGTPSPSIWIVEFSINTFITLLRYFPPAIYIPFCDVLNFLCAEEE